MIGFIVFGGILLLVGCYFALDWWLAGRTARRSLPDDHPSPRHIHAGGGGGHEDRIHNLDQFKGSL